MKKIIFCLISCLIGSSVLGQNLSIQETIEYINKNLIENSQLSLSKNGILTYSTLTKNNFLDMPTYTFDYEFSETGNKSSEEYKEYIAKKKTIISINISDLYKVESINLNYKYNPNYKYNSLIPIFEREKEIKEWAITIRCKTDEVYYVKSGDCISVQDYGQYGESYFHHTTELTIRSSDGYKKSSEKIRNALLYLVDLAKQNGYDTKEDDDDPFASNNFNTQKFDIESKQDSDNIKLTSQNGVYYINVKIGGISKKFILDSGASDVLISKELETELINAGIVKKEDYLPDGFYKIADGSIVKCRRLVINELNIGGFTVKNVRATVNTSNTMLLGKSVLDKFKNWSIDNLNKTLKLEK